MASFKVTCVPRNLELLWLQAKDTHHAYNIFHDRDVSEPRCRKGDGGLTFLLTKKKSTLCEKVMRHIKNVGFEGVLVSVVHKVDHPLITALVERWRPETNTFHFPIGEVTVTLHDVQVIWGLPIDGPAVTGKIKMMTLAEHIDHTFDANNDLLCLQRAILALIGSKLFHDSNTYDISLNYLQYLEDLSCEGRKSWGSTTLACLYRNLSKGTMPQRKGIDGGLLLLQYWAWERMSRIAPRVTPFKEKTSYNYGECLANKWHGKFSHVQTPAHVLTIYQSFFNALTNDQFLWTPYTTFIHLLPRDCTHGQQLWAYIGPLIHWEEVESHLAQRIARQFGMIQTIPNEVGLMEPQEWNSLRDSLRGEDLWSTGV
uniref:serine/threonine-protein phosphatase 7 long form homolog n=1 Tax=Erigeron canadensis TaxID=72917 RepID=UPI001CB93C6E|nr:serine/threonine-protein phosphatase 7 long form homolog [Erigeron canadensis]